MRTSIIGRPRRLSGQRHAVIWNHRPTLSFTKSLETDRQGIEFLGFLIGLPVTFGWLVLGLVVTSLVGLIKNLRWWRKGLLSLGICLALTAAIVAIIIQVR
ncbi:hypothetical protein [Brevibacterium sp. H-BE7]|uniref:hypothetical protein n=1 Tax=Brevibacterium sp. H-BE7 TaxID=1727208 RepID=UPI00254D318B|nr:hypothetical protein [Brevibacterium sp. H-BE7]MDK8435078.1 hypothetical protein [Brevibacterium sp. H-BE7]